MYCIYTPIGIIHHTHTQECIKLAKHQQGLVERSLYIKSLCYCIPYLRFPINGTFPFSPDLAEVRLCYQYSNCNAVLLYTYSSTV